jgi:hypothetical protein
MLYEGCGVVVGRIRDRTGVRLFFPETISGDGDQSRQDEKSAWRSKREVEERERQLTRAQRELAEARARLAVAGGAAVGVTERRKAEACCQMIAGFHEQRLERVRRLEQMRGDLRR